MTVLLCIIYLSFISLGLPDSLLGAAWPTMRLGMGAPVELAGALSMVCAGGTILSSLMSTRLIQRFGTGKVTAVSVAMTAVALVGYALAPSPWLLFVAAVPLGLGAGSVDAALNNYVSLHYAAKHMSWLHCFWGLGATLGPMLLSACMTLGGSWRVGYWAVIAVQAALTVVLFASQPLWKRTEAPALDAAEPQATVTNAQALRLPGMKAVMLTFFCYCAVEASVGLWTASYMTEVRGVTAEEGALAASLYFMGITVGRALNGFLAMRFTSKTLIRTGALVMLAASALMLIAPWAWLCFVATGLFGLGCAPIYPCAIHETPRRFGAAASQAATGLQMATAYTGSTFMPPLMGLIARQTGLGVLPWWMLLFTVAMFWASERCR